MTDSFSPHDFRMMAEALRLAARGLYTTDPNPRVGCVLVKNEVIVGRGYHRVAGEGHAEVNAIADAGGQAKGSTAYVTLEPCSHYGKTPPCADALIKAGVVSVVAAMTDPNPVVSGAGFKKLEQAGIRCRSGLMADQAVALNPGFVKRMRSGLPFVRIKLACSLDGRTAMASGESQWITGPDARADVQRMRARSSAIVCGIDSVLDDDPSMTVRASETGLPEDVANIAATRQPLRVILDSHLRLNADAKLLRQEGPILLIHDKEVIPAEAIKAMPQVECVGLDINENNRLPLAKVLEVLAQRGCNEVLVESGATLAGAFVKASLWDELVVYMAPKLMGSRSRPLMDLPIDKMSAAIELEPREFRQVGTAMKLTYGRVACN